MATKLYSLKTKFLGASSTPEESTALFRKIYDEHKLYVRKTLYWVVGKDLVDDAVQDTFVNVWRKIDQFEGRSNVKTWIYRVAINSGLSILRKNKKHNGVESMEDVEIAGETQASDVLLQKRIEQGILSLNEKFRIVFVLYYKQDLSVKEISETLKIAEGTVKSRLHTARDDFKHYLEKHGVNYE